MFASTETIIKNEVTVKGFDRDFVELEIKDQAESLSWPRSSFPDEISIGAKFIIEVKKSPLTTISKIVQVAKNENERDHHSMRRLLEQLIN